MNLAAPTGKTSLTSNGAVRAVRGYYYGYTVTAVTATAAITVYDNASAASGTVIDIIPATTAAGTSKSFAAPIPCTNGVYAQFGTATGTVLFLHGE
jgi:hypothetical protein